MPETQFKILTLNSILQMIENGSISIPSFSRGFVWTANSIKNLFDSVNRGYPIGMILAVDGETDRFVRLSSLKSYFPDADSEGFETWNTLWILDGSQRLAALYNVLKGKHKTFELQYDLGKKEFFFGKERVSRTLPMSSLFDATDFRRIQTSLAHQKDTEKLIDELHDIHNRFSNYAVPFQITRDLTNEEMIDIFTTLNVSGVPLRRREIEKAKGYQELIEELQLKGGQQWAERATIYQQQGRLAEAETVLMRFVEEEPNDVKARTELAKVYQRQNKLADAEALLLLVLQISSKDLNSRTELAKIYQRQGRLVEAEKVLTELLELEPADLQARTELAKIYQRQGKLAEAEGVLAELLELEPTDLQARTELAKIYQRQGKLVEAERVLAELLQLDTGNLQARTELAKIYQRQGKLVEAEKLLLESLELDNKQLHPRTELARVYQRQGKLAEAEKLLLESLELDEHQLYPRTELARIYQRQGKLAEAEKLLLESLELDSNQLHPRTELARIYQRQGKLAEAEKLLLESLKLDHNQLHPRIELARIYQRQGQLDNAAIIAEDVLLLDPLNDFAMSELLGVWSRQGEKEKCAKRFLAFIQQSKYKFTRSSQAPVFRFFQCCRKFGMKDEAKLVYERFQSQLDDRNVEFYKSAFVER